MDALAVLTAYLLGAIPFTQIVSRRLTGIDLRTVGTGTVSGTGLYRVAGLWPLVLGGGLDVGKGAGAALLAGDGEVLRVLVGAAVVTGHCWSVFLGGAGGRGLSPSLGVLAVFAWPGALLLLAALGVGKLVDEAGLAAFIADLLLVVALATARGGQGAALALALVLPMVLKRLMGNAAPEPGGGLRTYGARLLYDADQHGGPAAPHTQPPGGWRGGPD